jgi:pSer/pThr/pTyr-binding forkhead associated (FHA) protein
MKISLEVISTGSMSGKIFNFDEPKGFTFGRSLDCTCVVPEDDTTFSRHHFMLEVNPPNVLLKDLGSLNGTRVNGIKYGGRPKDINPEDAEYSEPVPLRDGDHILAGDYEFLLKIDAPALCVDCGKEIPLEKRKAAEFIGGSYLCLDCREKEEKKKRAKEEGKAAFAPNVPPDKLEISMEQRIRAEQNPAAVIEEILKQFIAARGIKRAPAIEGYVLEKELGIGGFGAVYSAKRVEDGKRVALKTMLQTREPPKNLILMFEREKLISHQLRHPNIIHCEKISQWNKIHFMEMEYMDGGSIWDLLNKKGKLSFDEAAPIMLQVLEGLAYAHSAKLTVELKTGSKEVKGVVHRDLKPPNILLSGRPGNWTAKISDFGLSKAFSEAGMTKGSISIAAGGFCGSPPYMAPEHIINYRYVKPATDVFEIATTFYHMLSGRPVWDPKSGQDIYKLILEGQIAPIRRHEGSIPKKVAEVIDKSLARDPADRYENAGEMLRALKKAL